MSMLRKADPICDTQCEMLAQVFFSKLQQCQKSNTKQPHAPTKALAIRDGFVNNLNENCSYLQKDQKMTSSMQQLKDPQDGSPRGDSSAPAASQPLRVKSEDLFQQQREVEIDHQGRIYRLRLTQMNKLILTA